MIQKDPWAVTAAIVSGVLAVYTLVSLLLICFVWRLPEKTGGWNGSIIIPWSLIDMTILMTCAIGLWRQQRAYGLALFIYGIFNFIAACYFFTNGSRGIVGLVFSLLLTLLYMAAYISMGKRKSRINSSHKMATKPLDY